MKWAIVAIVLIGILLFVSNGYLGVVKKDCGNNKECWSDSILTCSPTIYRPNEGVTVFRSLSGPYTADKNSTAQIEGMKGDACKAILENVRYDNWAGEQTYPYFYCYKYQKVSEWYCQTS